MKRTDVNSEGTTKRNYLRSRQQATLRTAKVIGRLVRLPRILVFIAFVALRPYVWAQAPDSFANTISGLKYQILAHGDGTRALPGQLILFHYVGRRDDGSVFFDSRTYGEPWVHTAGSFNPREGLTRGLSEGLELLANKSNARILAPPELGYGNKPNVELALPANSTLCYEVEILGIKSRKLPDLIWEAMQTGGMPAARKSFAELKSAGFPDVYVGSNGLNYFGYGVLYQLNRADDAIEVFSWACDLFPQAADLRDSLGEAYYIAGDRTMALKHYSTALELDPKHESARRVLAKLHANPLSPTRFERLEVSLRRAGTFLSPPFSSLQPNYSYLQSAIDEYLADKGASVAEKQSLVESLLMLANRTKPSNIQALYAQYLANPDPEIVAVAQRTKEAPEKNRIAREAAKKAKEEIQKKTVDLKFTAIDGREVDTKKLKGKVLLVDFWATWCGPCVEEIPNIVAVYGKYHDKGFEAVGITLDQDSKPAGELLEFTKKYQMPWPQCFDVKRGEQAFSKQFGIEAIPAMFLLDQNGMIVSTNARGPKLEQEVRRLLGLKPLAESK